jgi:hypothetical protein
MTMPVYFITLDEKNEYPHARFFQRLPFSSFLACQQTAAMAVSIPLSDLSYTGIFPCFL